MYYSQTDRRMKIKKISFSFKNWLSFQLIEEKNNYSLRYNFGESCTCYVKITFKYVLLAIKKCTEKLHDKTAM